MSGQSFEPVDALRRISDSELVRYRCFRVLPENKYWVQDAERFPLPLADEEKREITEQSMNVLSAVPFAAGEEIGAFGQMYDTLDEAIAAYEASQGKSTPVKNSSGGDDLN